MKNALFTAAVLALALPTVANAAATQFYVGQDAKSHACMVMNAKPDGKAMMDVGTKAYESEDNAKKALSMLKACATPAGFYVVQDAKTKKCSISDKAPDGKAAMDVGTKVYESEDNAKKALVNLNACK